MLVQWAFCTYLPRRAADDAAFCPGLTGEFWLDDLWIVEFRVYVSVFVSLFVSKVPVNPLCVRVCTLALPSDPPQKRGEKGSQRVKHDTEMEGPFACSFSENNGGCVRTHLHVHAPVRFFTVRLRCIDRSCVDVEVRGGCLTQVVILSAILLLPGCFFILGVVS